MYVFGKDGSDLNSRNRSIIFWFTSPGSLMTLRNMAPPFLLNVFTASKGTNSYIFFIFCICDMFCLDASI